MTRILVTGAAGFIGSNLCDRLCSTGYQVVGLDCFLDNYPRDYKEANLKSLLDYDGFTFIEGDLAETELAALLDGVTGVFHLAARPGVRESWGRHFDEYLVNNVLATQKLLEAVKDLPDVSVIYASSSSVYGNVDELPVTEEALPRPVSPYGATKLAAEDMVDLYRRAYGTKVTTMRLFSVYGPRQRPDMAVHRFLKAVALGDLLTVFGDGSSGRDYTYVDYVVDACVDVFENGGLAGEVFNVASGKITTLTELVEAVEGVLGKSARVEKLPAQRGDVRVTHADISRLRAAVSFNPDISIDEGIARQAAFMEEMGFL